jgi:hypothetical protein
MLLRIGSITGFIFNKILLKTTFINTRIIID